MGAKTKQKAKKEPKTKWKQRNKTETALTNCCINKQKSD